MKALFTLLILGLTAYASAQQPSEVVATDTARTIQLIFYHADYYTPDPALVKLKKVEFSDKWDDYKEFYYIASTQNKIGPNKLRQLTQRNINLVANVVAGVNSSAGEKPSIRGASPEGTAYYIDGMRVRFLCEDDMYVSLLK